MKTFSGSTSNPICVQTPWWSAQTSGAPTLNGACSGIFLMA
jgi:hypothetical protein